MSNNTGPSQTDVRRSGNEAFAELDAAVEDASNRLLGFTGGVEDVGLTRLNDVLASLPNITGENTDTFVNRARQEFVNAGDRDRNFGQNLLFNPNTGQVANAVETLTDSLALDSLLGDVTLPESEAYQNLAADLTRFDPASLRPTIAGTEAGSIPLTQQDIGFIDNIDINTGLSNYGSNFQNQVLDPRDVPETLGDVRGSQFGYGNYLGSYTNAAAKRGLGGAGLGARGGAAGIAAFKIGQTDQPGVFSENYKRIGRQAEGANINQAPTFVGQQEDTYDTRGNYAKKQTDITLEGGPNLSANLDIVGRGARDYSEQIGAIGTQPGLDLERRVNVGERREGQGIGYAPETVDSYNIGGSELKGTDAYTRDYGIGQGPQYDVNVGRDYGVGARRQNQGAGLTQDFGVGTQSGKAEEGLTKDFDIGKQVNEEAQRAFGADYGVGATRRGRIGFAQGERIARDVGNFGRLGGGFRENFGIGQQADPGIFNKNERQLGRIAGAKFLR